MDSITYSIKTMTLQKDKGTLLVSCLEMNSGVAFVKHCFCNIGTSPASSYCAHRQD